MRSGGWLTFVVGGAVLLLACLLAALGLPASYRPVVAVFAEILAAISLIIAIRFNRSRLAVAAGMIAFTNYLLRHSLLQGAAAALPAPGISLLFLALPINLGILAFFRDRPLTHPRFFLHVLAVAGQPLAGKLLMSATATANLSPSTAAAWVQVLSTTQAPLLAFLIASVFTALALALKRTAFEASLLWVLVCCGLVVFVLDPGVGSALVLTAAQIILLTGLVEQSYRLAYHDELTGLPGRRALNETMRSLHGDFALAMVDVDKFKNFNDRYGHDAGDQALRMIAEELMHVQGGRTFRYGGEEFSIVFAGKTIDNAREPLEEIRASISSKRFTIRSAQRPRKKPKRPTSKKQDKGRQVTITVSLGLAGPTKRRTTPEEVLAAADKALYKAKKNGRNRLVVA